LKKWVLETEKETFSLDYFSDNTLSLQKATTTSKRTELYFELSNNPCDLLLLGKETEGCQNIDLNPSYNKCLLGYIFGKNRILTIKKPKDGRIIARSVERLLWDDKAKCLKIFIEKVYSLNPDPRLKRALLAHAQKIANEFNIKLVISKDFFDGNQSAQIGPYPNGLISFGSYAPYEYSDSANGIQEDGKYQRSNGER
jgi:hypothetical protein